MTDEKCGYETPNGPCKNPATDGDSCWIESHGGHVDGHGRDSKLTMERQEGIATVIEQGGSISEAARKNGIHRETFYRWMSLGEDQNEGIYADFYDRLTRARGQGEGTYRTALMRIALENDDAATLMSMMKQRYPESWGDVDRGEQQGGVVVNVEAEETTEIDPETLEVQE